MPLKRRFAINTDAPRIAEIHMAAFGKNAMLRAQFPSADARQALQKSIEAKALSDITDPKSSVLVVKDSSIQASGDKGSVIEGEDYVEPPWIWPEGTDFAILTAWAKQAEEAQRKAMGNTPCYRKFWNSFYLLHKHWQG